MTLKKQNKCTHKQHKKRVLTNIMLLQKLILTIFSSWWKEMSTIWLTYNPAFDYAYTHHPSIKLCQEFYYWINQLITDESVIVED